MYCVSAQSVDEHMINVHYYYYCVQEENDIASVQHLLLHQPSSQATSGLEAGRRGRKVGREGSGLLGQEAEKEERCSGGPGEGPELSRAVQQVRHHPQISRWAPAGVAPQRSTTCHLLSSVALAWPAVSPWAQGTRVLRVSLLGQAEGSLHQPVSLQACGKSRWELDWRV